MVVNYNKGIIYKLCCKDPEITDIYIGSTTDFTKRKWKHKHACKKSEQNVYNFIRENGNWDNWDMIQVEAYKAENKRDLESRERRWIETLKSTLNSYIPTRTSAEHYQNNKEKIYEIYQNNKEVILEKRYEFYENNKEVILERVAEYYENNKEVILERMAVYYQNNKEVIAEKGAVYYQNNKEVIAEKKAVKVVCDCGLEVTKVYLAKHKKTQKHINLLETHLELPISVIHSA